MAEIIEALELAFREKGEGRVEMPPKPGIHPGAGDNFNSGFLPAAYQGSVFKAGSQPLANITPAESKPGEQRRKLDLVQELPPRGPR